MPFGDSATMKNATWWCYRIGCGVRARFACTLVIFVIFGRNFVWAGEGDSWARPSVSQDTKSAKKWVSDNSVRLGNSSIWIAKYDEEALKTAGKLPSRFTVGDAITRADIPIVKMLLAPYLDPKYGERHAVPAWYRPNVDDVGYMVSLDSNGGDIRAAIEIGKIFRKARVLAVIGPADRCFSACVFLLAGAVKRINNGPVGIHRPYSSSASAKSYERMQEDALKLGELVRTYLIGMNIPDSLYDAMRRVPPDDNKILSPDELESYGLNSDDPVFSDLKDNSEARLANISKRELFERKLEAKKCVSNGFLKLKRVGVNGDVDLLEFGALRRTCEEQTIYKDVIGR